jgi:hypothetical protein
MFAKKHFKNQKKMIKSVFEKFFFKVYYRFSTDLFIDKDEPAAPPFIVTGIYRSGTTLVTSLLEALGVDLGPQEHKFQNKGRLAVLNLNPDGFQENFLINDLGRYILHYAGGSGVDFPNFEKIAKLSFSTFDNADFAYYALKVLKDDRVSNQIRRRVLSHYNISNINQYFCDYFDTALWGFKDVHSGAIMPVYQKKWQKAKWICVFREPSSFLQSAKKLSPNIAEQTWIEYYSRVLQTEPHAKILWIAYEDVLNKNERTIMELIKYVKKKDTGSETTQKLFAMVDPSLNHGANANENVTDQAAALYQRLRNKSVDHSRK